MKKWIAILSLAFLLSGCDHFKSSDSIMKGKFMEIDSYIQAQNVDGIYNEFSAETRKAVPDLKENIKYLFRYYRGNFKQLQFNSYGVDGQTEYGTYTEKHIFSRSTDIYTNHARYHVNFCYQLINRDNPDSIGFQYIYFERFEGIKKQQNEQYDRIGLVIYGQNE